MEDEEYEHLLQYRADREAERDLIRYLASAAFMAVLVLCGTGILIALIVT